MSNIIKCDAQKCSCADGHIIHGLFYELEFERQVGNEQVDYDFEGHYHKMCHPDWDDLLKTLKKDEVLTITLRKE